VSYCLTACCLEHREEVFWNPYFGAWVTLSCRPCSALAGEPDPTELRCSWCGQRTEVDGGGQLWTHVPDAPGHWEQLPEGAPWGQRWRWHDDKWTRQCGGSPAGVHQVLGTSQASGLA
jgi:hypothetical protein